jgi:hypothetical protein
VRDSVDRVYVAELLSTSEPSPPIAGYSVRACEYCGNSFEPARAWQKYDTPLCRNKASRERRQKRLEQNKGPKIRKCANPDCTKTFVKKVNQRVCQAEECLKWRAKDRDRRLRNENRNRRCKFCRRTDKMTSFQVYNVCCGCGATKFRNGVCEKHKTTLNYKDREGNIRCPKCHPYQRKTGEVEVHLFWRGRRKTVARSPNTDIFIRDTRLRLKRIKRAVGTISVLVDEACWLTAKFKRPHGVRGMVPARWPVSLGWLSTKKLYSLLEIASKYRTGELIWLNRGTYGTDVVSHLSPQAAERSWIRLRKELASLNAPVKFAISSEDGSESVKLSEAFLRGIERELDQREIES